MPDGLIHFGIDEFERLSALRSAGFDVRECRSLLHFRTSLCARGGPGPVSITDHLDCLVAISVARATHSSPLILFRGRDHFCDETEFDLVVPVATPPSVWMPAVVPLLDKTPEPVTTSIRPSNPPSKFADIELECLDCRTHFVFHAAEQEFFEAKGFWHLPKRCKRCRMLHAGKRPGRISPDVEVECAVCGSRTTVPFRPRLGRPVLCRSCFAKQQDRSGC